jgi:8-oxo-dGTP pyrophosphatase MutT (NUDIX family)
MTETAVRETLEETGVTIEITGLIGIYFDPAHVIAFSDNEVRRSSRSASGPGLCPASRARAMNPPRFGGPRVIDDGYADRAPYYT